MANKRRMTQAQADRQSSRDRAGRYAESYRCELCGRPTGNYCSDPRCNNTGLGQILCDKCARVLDRVPTATYTAWLTRSTATPTAERRTMRDDLLAAEQKDRTSCVSLRLSRRGSGPVVGIYERAIGYEVVCEQHATCIEARSLASAKSAAVDTSDFCETCRG